MRPIETPERALVVAAHPGEADLAVAGSIIRWAEEGSLARLVCCTSGDASGDDASADPLELSAIGEAAQRRSAELSGYSEVTFLHRPDGAVANDLALREQLVRAIRAFRPTAVIAPDPRVLFPSAGGIRRADQRTAGLAAIDAIEPAARAMAFPHLALSGELPPHAVARVLLYETEEPGGFVDISDALDRKLAVVRAFVGTAADADAVVTEVRVAAERLGEAAGVSAAEGLAIIRMTA